MEVLYLLGEFKKVSPGIRADKSGAVDQPGTWRICNTSGYARELVESLCSQAGKLLPGNGDPMTRWLDHLAYRGPVEYHELVHVDGKSKGKPAAFVLTIKELPVASQLALVDLPESEDDKKNDNGKKSKKYIRPMNAAAIDCVRRFKEAKQSGVPLSMEAVVSDYVDEVKTGSPASIMRTLNDNPSSWKDDKKTTKRKVSS